MDAPTPPTDPAAPSPSSSPLSEGYVWQAPRAPLPPLAGPPSAPPPARRFRSRTFAIASAALGLLLVLAVGGGAFAAYRAIYGHDDRATADYVPTNAYAYVAINTDPTSHAWLDAWGIAKQVGVDDDLAALPQKVANAAGQDPNLWHDLVKPALGQEIGVAVWPGATADSVSVAGIIQTNDADKARALIPRVLDDDAPTSATYRGVSYQRNADGEAVGLVDGALVIANREAAFTAVVDAHLDGALSAQARFKTAADRAADNPLVFAWLDSSAIQQAAQAALPADLSSVAGQLPAGADLGVVTVTLKADGSALRLTALTEHQPDGVNLAPAGADAFASQLPASTLAYLASSDFYGRVWQPLAAQYQRINSAAQSLDGSSAALGTVDGLASIDEIFGVDPKHDIIAHMTGPFAIAADAARQDSDYAVGAHFAAQLDDPAAVHSALDALAGGLAAQGAPVERTSDGFSITQDDIAVSATVQDNALRLDVRYGAPSESGALADNADYQHAMSALPPDAAWRGYVSLKGLLALVPPDEWSSLDPDVQTALRALDALAFSTSADGAGMRTDVVLFGGE